MVETHWTHQLITEICQFNHTEDDLRTRERQSEPAPEGRVPPSRPVSPVWPIAFYQAWGQGWGWAWKGHRHRRPGGRRAADITDSPGPVLCAVAPGNQLEEWPWDLFVLSYWNSATSWDWGVWGMDGRGGKVVGILGSEWATGGPPSTPVTRLLSEPRARGTRPRSPGE